MPRPRTVLKHVTELSQVEYVTLWSMNLGDEGSMQWRLEECWNKQSDWVVMHLDKTGMINGWALLFQNSDNYYAGGLDQWVAYFFTPESNRRNGIGTHLMRHVRRVSPEPFVVPWTAESGGFFKSCGTLRCSRYRKSDYGLDSETVVGV